MADSDTQKLQAEVKNAQKISTEKHKEIRELQIQLQKIKKLQQSAKMSKDHKPGGELIFSVADYKDLELKEPPAPKFHIELLPNSTCPKAYSGCIQYECSQIIQMAPITTTDFKIKIVPYCIDDNLKLCAVIPSKEFLKENKPKRTYKMVPQGSEDKDGEPDFKVGDIISTQFGEAQIEEIRDAHLVAKTKDWKIAGGQSAVLYLRHSVVKKQKTTEREEEDQIEVGDTVCTQFGKAEVMEIRPDHLVVSTLDWKLAGGAPATLYLRPAVVSKTKPDPKHKVGDTVCTQFGKAEVKEIRPDHLVVSTLDWKLAGGAPATLYLRPAAVSKTKPEPKQKPLGSIDVFARYVSPDPYKEEVEELAVKLQTSMHERAISDKKLAELTKKLKKIELSAKKSAKKEDAAPTEPEAQPTSTLGKLASPFKMIYNNREILWKLKNIAIFIGGVALMHYKGDEVAL